MGAPADFTIVARGAGRGEMAPAFAEWRYVPVEIDSDVPDQVRGVFFSNEFFDALSVEAVFFLRGEFCRRFVAWKEGRFVWMEGDLASPELAAYFRRFFRAPADGNC